MAASLYRRPASSRLLLRGMLLLPLIGRRARAFSATRTPPFSSANAAAAKIDLARRESVDALTEIINRAYRAGETGILVDTPDRPFERVTGHDVEELVQREQLLCLYDDGEPIGCIKCAPAEDEEGVGEWGCLALAANQQGKGYGTVLVRAAETYLRDGLGMRTAHLELLAPSSWKHEHKERLRDWYTRMGYELKVPGNYDASTMSLPATSILGGRFELKTDADFTAYRKELCC